MKRIRKHVYFLEKSEHSDTHYHIVESPDGSLFSGPYKTKIFPADLPEWYIKGRYSGLQGYMSARGIVDMLFIDSKLGTFMKDNILLISYRSKIELRSTNENKSCFYNYLGYDEEIIGTSILSFLPAVKKYSGLDVMPIVNQIKDHVRYLRDNYPRDYDEKHIAFLLKEIQEVEKEIRLV